MYNFYINNKKVNPKQIQMKTNKNSHSIKKKVMVSYRKMKCVCVYWSYHATMTEQHN